MSVLVGQQAPDFKAAAVINGQEVVADYTLSQFKGNKYVVLFFYPFDFTFVCPTEILSFQQYLGEFEKRNTQVIGVSVDSKHSHYAWLNTPLNKGGIQGVTYPLVSDINKTISRDYDVLAEGKGFSYRGLFLIDKNGVVRHQLVNDAPLGRNVEEAIRMVDALQYFEKNGEVCPAGWTPGKATMKESYSAVADYLAKHNA